MTLLENVLLYVAGALLLLVGRQRQQLQSQSQLATEQLKGSVDVVFGNEGDLTSATTAICNELARAKQHIIVMAYYLNNETVVTALRAAVERNVTVELIVDGAAGHIDALQELMRWAPCWVDKTHKAAHNRFIIIDRAVVVTGELGFGSNAEEHGAAQLLVIRSPTVADQYIENWSFHAHHSQVTT